MTNTPQASNSFAKKYRPLLLKNLIGQDQVRQQIAGMLKSGRIPCALLLTGVTGCGKTTIARIIARQINKVMDCTPFNDIYEFDIGTNGTMEDIRKLVETTNYLPKNKNHKSIYILDEVHKLTKASASALLKTIEEPPAHAMFILCTNEPDQLLTTVVNRCEKITLKAYTEDDILKLLQHVCSNESIEISEENLRKIAVMSNLQPRECLSTLQGVANIIAGGKAVTPEDIEEAVKTAVSGNIFDYSNSFLISLYIKNYTAAIKRIDECPDTNALLNISVASNKTLVKYFASLGVDSYKPNIPFYTMKVKDMIKQKVSNLDINGIRLRSAEIHRILVDSVIESRRTNVDLQDILISKIGVFCLS